MITTILLACKIDQGLQNKNQYPGHNLQQQECDCPDNTDEIATLTEELNTLRERVVELEASTAEVSERIEEFESAEPPASTLVVTEYEVDCSNQTVLLDKHDYYGAASPLTYTTSGDYTREDHPWACVIAKIDPSDPPWSITPSYVEDLTLTKWRYSRSMSEALTGGDYPEVFDLMSNFGNEWIYEMSGSRLNTWSTIDSRIHQDGWVVSGIPWQADCTSYTSSDGDCPLRSDLAKLRVVILDDKAYDPPSAW